MEFYFSFLAISAFVIYGFNSQRDGILPNFTSTFIASIKSFNSQRDGILLVAEDIQVEIFEFQFPTGWNSTFDLTYFYSAIGMFQFPTGWNSTCK